MHIQCHTGRSFVIPVNGISLQQQHELFRVFFVKVEFHLPVEQGTVCLKLGMSRAVVWAFWGGGSQGQGTAGSLMGMEGVEGFPKEDKFCVIFIGATWRQGTHNFSGQIN